VFLRTCDHLLYGLAVQRSAINIRIRARHKLNELQRVTPVSVRLSAVPRTCALGQARTHCRHMMLCCRGRVHETDGSSTLHHMDAPCWLVLETACWSLAQGKTVTSLVRHGRRGLARCPPLEIVLPGRCAGADNRITVLWASLFMACLRTVVLLPETLSGSRGAGAHR
jgi:hypothetical protein